MNSRELVQRLKAHSQGKAIPRGEKLSTRLCPPGKTLLVAFVRMGGESSPWGVAYGYPGQKPVVLTVADPRRRDSVSLVMADFSDALIKHLQVTKPDSEAWGNIWVPNKSHLEMLHFLAYSYVFARYQEKESDPFWRDSVLPRLRALGRAANWIFHENSWSGQQLAIVATEALKAAYTFPSESIRQSHLGFLLSWLGKGTQESRFHSACKAEESSISTSLSPEIERKPLADLVERFGEMTKHGNLKAADECIAKIHEVVGRELLTRLSLVEKAFLLLKEDGREENAGVEKLVAASRGRLWRYFNEESKIQSGRAQHFQVLHPETDKNPLMAAQNFRQRADSDDQAFHALIHDDRELQDEAVAEGYAFRGELRAVETTKIPPRTTRYEWEIVCPSQSPIRFRVGEAASLITLPKIEGEILSIHDEGAERTIRLQITKGQRSLPDGPRKGKEVTFIPPSGEGFEFIRRKKEREAAKSEWPGRWLLNRLTSKSEVDSGEGEAA